MAYTDLIRIILVDDDESFHLFMKDLLDDASVELRCCVTGAGALEELRVGDFDLLLIDQQLPDMLGVEILKWLCERNVDTPRVMVTGHATVPMAVEAMKLGAADVFCKPIEEPDKLLRFINRTLALDPPLPLSQSHGPDDTPSSSLSGDLSLDTSELIHRAAKVCPDLTEREVEVLEQIVSGLSNKEIGSALHISERTVKNHTSSIYRKLSVDSRPKLFLRMLELSRGGHQE